jgi:pimeloyl-ACP methyl ester carboxylesterase
LAAQLSNQIDWEPDATRFLVGHSHGGNVILRALRLEPRLESSIKGVACLATPFFGVAMRANPSRVIMFTQLLFVLLYILSFVLLLYLSHYAIAGAVAVLFLPASLVLIFAGVSFGGLILDAQKFFRQRFQLSVSPTLNLLILRTNGDEATSVLTWVLFWNWVLDTIWWLPLLIFKFALGLQDVKLAVMSLAAFSAVVAFIVGSILSGGSGLYLKEVFDNPIGFVLFAIMVFAALPFAISLATLALTVVSLAIAPLPALFLGIETFVASYFVRFSAEAVPEGVWTVIQKDTVQPKQSVPVGGFLHSVYEDDGILRTLALWLDQSLSVD